MSEEPMFIRLTLIGHAETPIVVNSDRIISFVRYAGQNTEVSCTSHGGDNVNMYLVRETPDEIQLLMGRG